MLNVSVVGTIEKMLEVMSTTQHCAVDAFQIYMALESSAIMPKETHVSISIHTTGY